LRSTHDLTIVLKDGASLLGTRTEESDGSTPAPLNKLDLLESRLKSKSLKTTIIMVNPLTTADKYKLRDRMGWIELMDNKKVEDSLSKGRDIGFQQSLDALRGARKLVEMAAHAMGGMNEWQIEQWKERNKLFFHTQMPTWAGYLGVESDGRRWLKVHLYRTSGYRGNLLRVDIDPVGVKSEIVFDWYKQDCDRLLGGGGDGWAITLPSE
jgi:hypothetical protein